MDKGNDANEREKATWWWLKRLLCWIGWHSIFSGFEPLSFDGCSVHARCKWCGKEGMVDSQGNLF